MNKLVKQAFEIMLDDCDIIVSDKRVQFVWDINRTNESINEKYVDSTTILIYKQSRPNYICITYQSHYHIFVYCILYDIQKDLYTFNNSIWNTIFDIRGSKKGQLAPFTRSNLIDELHEASCSFDELVERMKTKVKQVLFIKNNLSEFIYE